MDARGTITGRTANTNTFALGEMTVTTILDGLLIRDNPASIFGIDQSAETVAALCRDNELPADRFVHCFVPTLVRSGGEVILFDTGFGPAGRANGQGQLAARLGEVGLTRQDVTRVVMTHMHVDHVGGLMEEDGPAFPAAEIVCVREEFDFWLDDARLGSPVEAGAQAVQRNLGPLRERVRFVADGEAVSPGITAVAAFGHSPGHTAYMLESAGKRLMLTADTANHYALSLQRPDWQVLFDMDKAKAAASRHRIFGMLADEHIPFIGHHMPFPSAGYVSRTDEGFRYMPMTYQLDL